MSVEFDIEQGVAIVAINRPQARNAIDRETALGIAGAVERIDADKDIRAAVLTGRGGTFCAGMDLKAFLRGENVRIGEAGFAGFARAKLNKPYVAAIEGYALAGGFELALACDMIVAAQDAQFGLSEVKRGLVANAGGLVRLPRQLPIKIAAELVLIGDMVPAATLAAHGLVNRIVPTGEALAVALEMAGKIAANGPMAVAVSRRVLNEALEWSTKEMFDRQQELTGPVFESADAREGAAAFAEKRTPIWQGG